MDVIDATYITRIFGTDSLFIPLRIPDVESEDPVKVLLHTQDADALEIYNGLFDVEESEAAVLNYFLEHRDFFYQTRDVTGLIQFGLESDSDDRDLLKRENENLDPKFVVLDEGVEPDWSLSFMLVPGLVLLYLIFFTDRLNGKPSAPPQPVTPTPPPGPVPPPPATP